MVIGVPSLFATLSVDEQTLSLGIPYLRGATVLYIISGIADKIYHWEGAMYLLLYVTFLAKLFGAF